MSAAINEGDIFQRSVYDIFYIAIKRRDNTSWELYNITRGCYSWDYEIALLDSSCYVRLA